MVIQNNLKTRTPLAPAKQSSASPTFGAPPVEAERQQEPTLSGDYSVMRLSQKQKQDITDIFVHTFDKPLNTSTHIIRNDLILNGIEITNNKTELKMKMGYFYE